MADEFRTERLEAVPISSDSTGWQWGTKCGQNPVDAVLHLFKDGEVVGEDLMWPIVLASFANITIDDAGKLISEAQAAEPQDWITRLRSNWP